MYIIKMYIQHWWVIDPPSPFTHKYTLTVNPESIDCCEIVWETCRYAVFVFETSSFHVGTLE